MFTAPTNKLCCSWATRFSLCKANRTDWAFSLLALLTNFIGIAKESQNSHFVFYTNSSHAHEIVIYWAIKSSLKNVKRFVITMNHSGARVSEVNVSWRRCNGPKRPHWILRWRGGRPHLNDNSSARGPNSSRGTNVESGSTGVVHLLTADFKWLVCGPWTPERMARMAATFRFRPTASHFVVNPAKFALPSMCYSVKETTCYSPFATCYLLLTTRYLLITTCLYYLLYATCYMPLAIYYLLLATF